MDSRLLCLATNRAKVTGSTIFNPQNTCLILRFIHDRVVALMAHDLLNIRLRFDDDVDLNVATLLNIFQNDWDDIMFGSGLANKDGRLIYFESI